MVSEIFTVSTPSSLNPSKILKFSKPSLVAFVTKILEVAIGFPFLTNPNFKFPILVI